MDLGFGQALTIRVVRKRDFEHLKGKKAPTIFSGRLAWGKVDEKEAHKKMTLISHSYVKDGGVTD